MVAGRLFCLLTNCEHQRTIGSVLMEGLFSCKEEQDTNRTSILVLMISKGLPGQGPAVIFFSMPCLGDTLRELNKLRDKRILATWRSVAEVNILDSANLLIDKCLARDFGCEAAALEVLMYVCLVCQVSGTFQERFRECSWIFSSE